MDKRKRSSVAPPQKSRFAPVHKAVSATSVNKRQSVPTMDKHHMLVVEANEITQYLKKQFVFDMTSDVAGDESLTQVRVRNTETKQSCLWTLTKMKERLQRLRKLMYADESEGQGLCADTVFFDPDDIWLNDDEQQSVDTGPPQAPKGPPHGPCNPTNKAHRVDPFKDRRSPIDPNSLVDNQANVNVNIGNGYQNYSNERRFHSNNAGSHSNRLDKAPSNQGVDLATLSNEEALPSVSVSIALESTQNTAKLPNGIPDLSTNKHPPNGLLSTTNSELPADSEFLRMSLASTLSTNGSPFSPPPPPKNFGENSGGGSSAMSEGTSQARSKHSLVPGGNRADERPLPAQQQAAPVIPERCLMSSSPGHTGSQRRPENRDKETHIPVEHTGPGDPTSHLNHRPIIKSRSPNVTPAPNSLKSSQQRSSKKKESVYASTMTVDGNINKKSCNQSNGPYLTTSGVESEAVSGKGYPRNVSRSMYQLNDLSSTTKSKEKPTHSRSSPKHGHTTAASENQRNSPHQSVQRKDVGDDQSVTSQKGPVICANCQRSPQEKDIRSSRKGKRTISSLRMCRDMVKTLTHRCKGPPRNDTLCDRIMYNCESIKIAVINILEAYTQAQESAHEMASFADCELVRLTSMQLVASMELLVSHSALLCVTEDTSEGVGHQSNEPTRQICAHINSTVRDLGKEMVMFLQACETDNDSVAVDASGRMVEQLYELLRSCGQLAVTWNLCPELLQARRTGIDDLMRPAREDDLVNLQPGTDMKQALLGGCDAWLGRCLETGVKTVQDCDLRAQMLSEDCYAGQESGTEVAKHAYIATTTTKILLLKCQEIQEDVNCNMRDESAKDPCYFHHYFLRCQAMLQNLNTLVDSVSLLCQASEPLVDDEDPSTLRKIGRCSEMINKATHKLMTSATRDLTNSTSTTSISDTPRSSISAASQDIRIGEDLEFSVVLTHDQRQHIEQCGEDVKMATQALCAVVRRRLPNTDMNSSSLSGSKVKRMLPATPGGVLAGNNTSGNNRGRLPMVRCKSAKQVSSDRLRKSLSYYDVGKTSNEV